jgi:hypothetical protein
MLLPCEHLKSRLRADALKNPSYRVRLLGMARCNGMLKPVQNHTVVSVAHRRATLCRNDDMLSGISRMSAHSVVLAPRKQLLIVKLPVAHNAESFRQKGIRHPHKKTQCSSARALTGSAMISDIVIVWYSMFRVLIDSALNHLIGQGGQEELFGTFPIYLRCGGNLTLRSTRRPRPPRRIIFGVSHAAPVNAGVRRAELAIS